MKKFKNIKCDLGINCKALCISLCRGKTKEALKEFVTRTENSDMVPEYRLALNALNYSIYHYMLFMYDVSLINCCYSNMLIIGNKIDKENFEKAAENIINTYYSEMLDLNLVTQNPIIKEILEYVDEHISEQIYICDLADKLHVNSTYLSQLFKSNMNQNFSAYLSQHRIHHAKLLLLQTGKTIEEISCECGFSSPSYFSTVFANKTGMSPGAYRKNHRLNCCSRIIE